MSLDLMRTMPSNVKFAAAGAKGVSDFFIKIAFVVHKIEANCISTC